jgi:hypothetical protein
MPVDLDPIPNKPLTTDALREYVAPSVERVPLNEAQTSLHPGDLFVTGTKPVS